MNQIKRFLCVGLCLLVVTQCLACSKTELEERCFPLLVTVDYDDDSGNVSFCAGFPRAENSGGSTGQTKELEVTTTKGKNFVESQNKYEKNLNKKASYP